MMASAGSWPWSDTVDVTEPRAEGCESRDTLRHRLEALAENPSDNCESVKDLLSH